MTLNRRFVDASSGHIYTHLTYHSCSWRSSMAEQRFCKPAGASEPLVIPMCYKGGGIVSWDAVWWYRAARRHNHGHSRDERLLTGVVVEGAAAEEHITTEKTFADKPSLTWAWEVEE